MGGGSKKFLHLLKGGFKKFWRLAKGGVKKVWRQKFSIARPPTKVFMNTPLPKQNSIHLLKML